MKPIGYADLASLTEDKRIAIISHRVAGQKETVGVALEADVKKIERYKRKLHASAPGLLEIEQLPGLVPNTVLLKIKPKAQNVADN